MDYKYKTKVLRELAKLDNKLVQVATFIHPGEPEDLTRETLAATADILSAIYSLRVDLRVKMFEFENGPTQGEA